MIYIYTSQKHSIKYIIYLKHNFLHTTTQESPFTTGPQLPWPKGLVQLFLQLQYHLCLILALPCGSLFADDFELLRGSFTETTELTEKFEKDATGIFSIAVSMVPLIGGIGGI